MPTTADRIHDALVVDLAGTVAVHRDDVDPDRLARELLDWEGGHRSLLGLTGDCRRAAYYDETVSLVHSFPVPEGSLESREDVESTLAGRRAAAYAHVVSRRGEWDWLHPRYRWLVDGDLHGAGNCER